MLGITLFPVKLRSRGLAVVVGAVVVCGCCATQAGAYVYWTSDATGAIGRANLDGSAVDQSFIAGGSTGQEVVAIDGEHVYWTNNDLGTIGRSNLDGSGANQSFITGLPVLAGIAVDAQHIYWSDDTDNTIGRANLDGSGVNQSFVTGVDFPAGLAVDARHIYWADVNGDTIGRANLDGAGVNQSFIGGANTPASVAVDGQHVYWANADGDTIGRANLDGTGVNQSFIPAADTPTSVAVDGQHVYWANDSGDAIGRANLDGTGVKQSFVQPPAPFGIAVDDGPAGTASPSPRELSFATQPVGTFGAPQTVTVTNTGHGILQFDSARVTSGAVNDFPIAGDSCSGTSIPIGGRCAISLRFGPGALGSRSATLRLTGNDAAGALQIPLSGTGEPLLPETQGEPGAGGIRGPAGAIGTTGPTGATGVRGPAGKTATNGVVALVRCRTVRHTVVRKVRGRRRKVKVTRRICTTKTITGRTRFTVASGRPATLIRAGVTYARGTELRGGIRPELLLSSSPRLRAGHYLLIVRWADRRHHEHVTRQEITVIAGREG